MSKENQSNWEGCEKRIFRTESIKLWTTSNLKKKRHKSNSKLSIDKKNNYAYVSNARRKLCENCGSLNHLTHAYKKPTLTGPKFTYK